MAQCCPSDPLGLALGCLAPLAIIIASNIATLALLIRAARRRKTP